MFFVIRPVEFYTQQQHTATIVLHWININLES